MDEQLTSGQKAARTKKRRAAALKAWDTRRKNDAAVAKKHRAAGIKAAATRRKNEQAAQA